jgi:hypothetical protein
MATPNGKKVVVLGFPLDRRVELEEALNFDEQEGKMKHLCNVVFAKSIHHALSEAEDAAVVVANTEECGDFFTKLFKGKFKGGIVPFASSRSQMSKGVSTPPGKLVFPTNYRGVKDEVLNLLNKISAKDSTSQQPVLAT